MKLNELTVKERLASVFVLFSMALLQYLQAADFKMLFFVTLCLFYLQDRTIENKKWLKSLEDELASLKQKLK